MGLVAANRLLNVCKFPIKSILVLNLASYCWPNLISAYTSDKGKEAADSFLVEALRLFAFRMVFSTFKS